MWPLPYTCGGHTSIVSALFVLSLKTILLICSSSSVNGSTLLLRGRGSDFLVGPLFAAVRDAAARPTLLRRVMI